MLHPVPFQSTLKNEPPLHPDDDTSAKRAKIDDIMEEEPSSVLAQLPIQPTMVSGSSPSESVPETQMLHEPHSVNAMPLSGDSEMEVVPSSVPASSPSIGAGASLSERVPETLLTSETTAQDSGQKVPSFKDKLLNSGTNFSLDEEDDIVIQQGDVSIGLNGSIPTVDFATHVLEALNKKIGLAVVVKLMGRRIGYRLLRTHLQNMWKPAGQFKLIDLADDCFLVRFKEDLDYQTALLSGPWMIFGHYLTVQPWTPTFKPHEHVINQVIGWIRLPRLPARYYHKSIIRSIGSVFGDVIRVDYNTDSGDRGSLPELLSSSISPNP
ncbi:hypothetical protein K1719_026912 [Acacia pycnantha]|nr:hypothetical protein K1719_026912 [Acacia pycnantha]